MTEAAAAVAPSASVASKSHSASPEKRTPHEALLLSKCRSASPEKLYSVAPPAEAKMTAAEAMATATQEAIGTTYLKVPSFKFVVVIWAELPNWPNRLPQPP